MNQHFDDKGSVRRTANTLGSFSEMTDMFACGCKYTYEA